MPFPVTSPPVLEFRRYRWLPYLIVMTTVLAIGLGSLLLRYVERRLVAASGEELMLAAAEVSDKVDRLLLERLGDLQIMARAFGLRSSDRAFLTGYLNWMKGAHAPMYMWLGVTNQQGVMIAATDEALIGQDYAQSRWFREARTRRTIVSDDVGMQPADDGIETVALTAPILDSQGNFLGVVSSRIAVSVIEDVTTRTIRSLEHRPGFVGSVEYQMLTKTGRVFVDSDVAHKGNLNFLAMGLPSANASQYGHPGFIEEDHLRRHVRVVTGYASTKGFDDLPGHEWTVLMRMDRGYVLEPIRSILWKIGIAGTVVWVPLLVLLLWSTSRLRAEYRQAQQES